MLKILAFLIKPFTSDCEHQVCPQHSHCLKTLDGNFTCVCNYFFAPADLDPKVPLECRFSYVSLTLTMVFTLLSLTCITWIIVAIWKACQQRGQYEGVQWKESRQELQRSRSPSVNSRESIRSSSTRR
uniref:EGF-like domain-containing protein n=1 Tax=Trichobilharzia regenti TaxID=157069 RepID=A0AA85IZP8_TRIRE|nr:unnamed protein product [Trichobilharzia regenti]